MKKLNAKRLAALAMTLVMLLGVLTACGDKADTNNGSGDGEGFPTMTIQIAHVNPTTMTTSTTSWPPCSPRR